MQKRTERTYAVINTAVIKDNISRLRAISLNKKIIAIMKASCYGHGFTLAKYIIGKIDCVGVATIEEGCLIRDICSDIDILILGYVPIEKIKVAIKKRLMITVYSLEQGYEINEYLKKLGKKIDIHIKINTGMNRLGFSTDSPDLTKILFFTQLNIVGIFSHYSVDRITNQQAFDKQTQRFIESVSIFQREKIEFKYIHISNSLGAPYSVGNAIRIGYGMYGYAFSFLVPSLSWYARVIHIFIIKKGDGVGYGRTFIADKDMKVATIAVGYGDGYPRQDISDKRVLFNGEFYPIIGRVCMDMLTIDITNSNIKNGDYVTLIGESGNNKITAEELGFGYKTLCGITPRVKRIYI